MCRSASGNTHLPLEDGLFEARAHHAQRPRALAAAPRCFAVRRLHAAALLAGDGLRRRAGGGRCGGRGRGGGLRVEAGEWAGGGGAPRERGAEAGQHCGGGGRVRWCGGRLCGCGERVGEAVGVAWVWRGVVCSVSLSPPHIHSPLHSTLLHSTPARQKKLPPPPPCPLQNLAPPRPQPQSVQSQSPKQCPPNY